MLHVGSNVTRNNITMKSNRTASPLKTLWRALELVILLAVAVPVQGALLVPTNSPNWRLFKGRTEAATPIDAWRFASFADTAFATSLAPFWYGDVRPGGTQLTDMINTYSCFFLRTTFVVTNLADITSLQMHFYIDDGFVMWINGVEVYRYGVSDPLTIATLAVNQAVDPAVFEDATLPLPVSGYLVQGTNLLCVQVFNTTLASSDIGFDCQIRSVAPDLVPPTIASQSPAPGTVNSLTSLTVNFSEEVTGVDPSVLLINGSPATDVTGAGASYTFTFPRPSYGPVTITWSANQSIADLGIPPNGFDGTAPGSTWQYILVDNTPPVVVNLQPLADSAVRALDQIEVLFSEPVANVNASDLLINGAPATDLSYGVPGQYIFGFPPPPTGVVVVAWASNHGIQDLAVPPNAFAGGSWTYDLDPHLAFADVRITEFMADNQNGIRDEDGTHQDWIELYNGSSTVVDLTGWYLTDDPANLTLWRFPDGASLQPHAYKVVWASGKDRTNNIAALHTSFKLNKQSGFLALVVSDGSNIVSAFTPSYPPQRTDVSYGRDLLDPTELGYYSTPTPGAPNTTGGPGDFAPDVVYARPSGTFVTPFTLALSAGSTNAVIRYVVITNYTQASISTTNIPTTNSPVYTGPIPINVTTEVRARAFETGRFPSTPLTQSYIQLSPNVVGFSSDRPLCIVHALGAGSVASSAQAGLIMLFNTNGGRTSLTNAPQVTTRMGFHLRGSSTLTQAKSNYKIEYWDEYNGDIKLPFLDMPDESDWVLYGIDGFDPGLMHNAIYHWFGRQLPGQFASRTRYVEVFRKVDNGPVTTNDYFGLYLAEESPKISKARLDFAALDLENTNPPSITGGYLMRIDRSGTGWNYTPSAVTLQPPQTGTINATPAPINIDDPKILTTTTDPRLLLQANYLRNYITSFLTNLASVSYTNPVTGYGRFIDTDQWIDHLIGNIICFNVDGYRLSGYFCKDRNDRLKQGPYWDCDRCMGTGGTVTPQADNRCFSPRFWRLPANDLGTDNGTDFFGLSNVGVSWFKRLFSDQDFWQRFIDRYQAFRTNEYSTNAVFAMLDGYYQEIKEAQVREQAKWAPSGFNFPRSGSQTVQGYTFDFGPADNLGRGRFTNEVNFQKKWFVDRFEFMDTNFLSMPTLSSGTALMASGSTVTATPAAKAGSRLLYTLDGTDPRLPGGGISPLARTNAGPLTLTITNAIRLFARSYNPSHANLTNVGTEVGKPLLNSFWSGPVAATYYTQTPSLRITEIMYHPGQAPAGDTNNSDNFEYVELTNIGADPLSLIGFKFANGIDFTFTATNSVTSLAPGGRVLVVANLASFLSRYPGLGGQVAGQYVGNLNNGGERLALAGPLGEPIQDFSYNNNWYPVTDGLGFSLVAVDETAPLNAWTNQTQWRASAYGGGSPGTPDPAVVTVQPVIVNEIMTHATLPAGDAIELWNPNPAQINIGYWYLTDDLKVPRKYLIPPDTTIPGYGFAVFYETNGFGVPGVTNALGVTNETFGLSANGEAVYVYSGDGAGHLTGYYQGFDFGPSAWNVTFGRYVNSIGQTQYVAQSYPTLGASNAPPLVGPVVISEIMYHPPDLYVSGALQDNWRDEFIELRNITGADVPLYDTLHPADSWTVESAVSFSFPSGVLLPAQSSLLVVGFDPLLDPVSLAAFQGRYGLSNNLQIFGPFSGRLNNAGERLELRRPGEPNAQTGLAPMILVDRVDYGVTNPWPATASGTGASLQRLGATAFGNDPANWTAAGPSPGRERVVGTAPTITVPPQPLSVVEESSGAFTATVGGTGPFLYQWYLNGQPLDGAYSLTLQLTNVQLNQAGNYDLYVLSDSGTALSTAALLTVLPLPVITQQPVGTNINLGSNIVLRVTATGTGQLRYQWQLNGRDISGATSNVLNLNNIQFVDSGPYRVVVTDTIGSRASQTVQVNVLQKPAITSQPASVTVAVGQDATIVMDAVGYPLPLSYRWRKTTAGSAATYFMTTDPLLVLTNAVLTNAGIYDVIVTNLAGQIPKSSNAYLTVVAPPANQVVAPGANAILRAVVSTPTNFLTRFQWIFKGNSVGAGTNNSIGTTLFTNDLVLTNVTTDQSGSYTFLITNTLGAPGAFAASLTVGNQPPSVSMSVQRQGTNAVLSWPDSATAWSLQEAVEMTALPNWQPSGAALVFTGGVWQAVVPTAGATNKFFRLHGP
jgi:hypothetical protein